MKNHSLQILPLAAAFVLGLCVLASRSLAAGPETFVPYTADTVPDSVTALWKDVDARKDCLEI